MKCGEIDSQSIFGERADVKKVNDAFRDKCCLDSLRGIFWGEKDSVNSSKISQENPYHCLSYSPQNYKQQIK